MARSVLLAALAGALFATLPAHAQDSEPQLDGAPPPLQIPATPKPPAPKPAVTAKPSTSTSTLQAEQARLARQAEAQQAEQLRLTSLAADLETRKANLDARERALAAQEADYTRKMASLNDRPPPALASAQPGAAPRYRVSYDDARRACTRAGMSEAIDNDFRSARYDAAPRYYERIRELRGPMRMDDRDGYLTVDTVCQLDANGVVLRFDVLR